MIERKRFSFSALLKYSRSERLCIGLDSPLCLSALLSAYSMYYSNCMHFHQAETYLLFIVLLLQHIAMRSSCAPWSLSSSLIKVFACIILSDFITKQKKKSYRISVFCPVLLIIIIVRIDSSFITSKKQYSEEVIQYRLFNLIYTLKLHYGNNVHDINPELMCFVILSKAI